MATRVKQEKKAKTWQKETSHCEKNQGAKSWENERSMICGKHVIHSLVCEPQGCVNRLLGQSGEFVLV